MAKPSGKLSKNAAKCVRTIFNIEHQNGDRGVIAALGSVEPSVRMQIPSIPQIIWPIFLSQKGKLIGNIW